MTAQGFHCCPVPRSFRGWQPSTRISNRRGPKMKASRSIISIHGRVPSPALWRVASAAAAGCRALGTLLVSERLIVPAVPEQVATARTWLHDRLGSAHPCGDAARTVVSELVANAIVHGSRDNDPVAVTVRRFPGRRVVVTVTDSGNGPGSAPRLRKVDLASTSGRGLQIVGAFATRWSIRRRGAGYRVRVLLSPKGGPAGDACLVAGFSGALADFDDASPGPGNGAAMRAVTGAARPPLV
ncbi:ATP-binding protein [Actinomadura gamaensis]|uniref:ATP-binding protein n=1 Tax=Actinomadura gamaensis TaxID=1763541 RepID=A0ABV9UBR0_9ACTN